MFKTVNLPTWVAIFTLIAFVMGSVSGLAAGVAVFLKCANAYIVAFVGCLGRDLGEPNHSLRDHGAQIRHLATNP